MKQIRIVGLDIAKSVFQVHGIDDEGEPAAKADSPASSTAAWGTLRDQANQAKADENWEAARRALEAAHKIVPKEEPDANSQDRHTDIPAGSEVGIEFLDGMSTGTARFIIDRKVSGDVLKKYEIKDLENKGSAEMNMWLHKQVMKKIAENGGKVPEDLIS